MGKGSLFGFQRVPALANPFSEIGFLRLARQTGRCTQFAIAKSRMRHSAMKGMIIAAIVPGPITDMPNILGQ